MITRERLGKYLHCGFEALDIVGFTHAQSFRYAIERVHYHQVIIDLIHSIINRTHI